MWIICLVSFGLKDVLPENRRKTTAQKLFMFYLVKIGVIKSELLILLIIIVLITSRWLFLGEPLWIIYGGP